MSKTPYELRFDILQLAKEQLQSAYYADMEIIRGLAMDANHAEIKKDYLSKMGTYPTMQDAITLAETIKHFVENK